MDGVGFGLVIELGKEEGSRASLSSVGIEKEFVKGVADSHRALDSMIWIWTFCVVFPLT